MWTRVSRSPQSSSVFVSHFFHNRIVGDVSATNFILGRRRPFLSLNQPSVGRATERASDLWKTCFNYLRGNLWWHNGYSVGLAINRSWVKIPLGAKLCNNIGQVVHTYVPLSLVPAMLWWCSVAGKVTAGLAESNGSLPAGWLSVDRDRLWAQCSITSMGNLYVFSFCNIRLKQSNSRLDGLWSSCVNMNVFATSTACCELDLQNLIRSSVGATVVVTV